MKAMAFDGYGAASDVLELREVPIPDTGDDGVVIRVGAAAINSADWHLINGVPFIARAQIGLRRPKVSGLGADLAGRVVEVGPAVTRFRPGEQVYGMVDDLPGTNIVDLGSVAEYVRVSEDSVRAMPAGLTPEEAAAVPLAATTALRGLRDIAGLQPGQHVLVNGASGGVGTFAVQIAKAFGAEVTGVCSTRNLELIRSLGADELVDYTREDPTRRTQRVDVVLDNVGNRPLRAWRRILHRDGTYVASFGQKQHRVLGPMGYLLRMAIMNLMVPQHLSRLPTLRNGEELDTLTELIEAGQVTPVIDRTYPLAAAAEAMEYLAGGHARGKVVITVHDG